MWRDPRFWRFAGLYGVLMLAALPLFLGWVPPNQFYGFRFPGALANAAQWYALNQAGARSFILAMAVCLLLHVLVFWKGTVQMRQLAGWINATLIVLAFWVATLELIGELPG